MATAQQLRFAPCPSNPQWARPHSPFPLRTIGRSRIEAHHGGTEVTEKTEKQKTNKLRALRASVVNQNKTIPPGNSRLSLDRQ